MKFGPVPLEAAVGKILGHNIAGPDGRRLLRKGARLGPRHIEILRRTGRSKVYVADLAPDDVDEDAAALRVARLLAGDGLKLSRAHAGRVNLHASVRGVLRVDPELLTAINECEGITAATLLNNSVLESRDMAATIKVIPFGLPESALQEIEQVVAQSGPILWLARLRPRRVGMILSGGPHVRDRIRERFVPPIEARLDGFGARLTTVDYVPLEDEEGERDLAATLRRQLEGGVDLIILAGETAIMDRHDIAPRAVERAGGEVTCFGAPVDPGNLLMLGYVDGVPVLGAPGCVRSPKTNVVDWVLPPLLAGIKLSRAEIIRLGHGGLLEDVPERPKPRARSPR